MWLDSYVCVTWLVWYPKLIRMTHYVTDPCVWHDLIHRTTQDSLWQNYEAYSSQNRGWAAFAWWPWYIRLYTYIYIYIHIYMCMYIFIYIHVCIYMYVYICVHVHICWLIYPWTISGLRISDVHCICVYIRPYVYWCNVNVFTSMCVCKCYIHQCTGDISTLADPSVVDELIANKQHAKWAAHRELCRVTTTPVYRCTMCIYTQHAKWK